MKKYIEKDIAFYSGDIIGDLALSEPDEDGLVDFALTADYDCARQDIINRLRTQTTDWRSHPHIGADLELLEGEPNTRETAMKGVERIYETLTVDGRFLASDLYVRPVPVSIEQVDFYVFLNAGKDEQIYVKQSQQL